MPPELWARVEEIMQAAIDRLPEERPAFVEAACGGDPALRREVESLLAAGGDEGFTGSQGFADALRILEQKSATLIEGRRIGAYRLLREIGHGGMGDVYEAARADDAFQKVVAIKIIHWGLNTEDIIRQFRFERQILAMLDHPNIARLLDGGATDDGLPYFVMEYIEGEPIDVYCRRHELPVTERLRLFLGVCAAVTYAHQNLVIHRDIKPGNVLVTKEGVPRLLDFGIAKALSSPAAPEQTVTALRPLTPEYASPEQVRGAPVTTASDVYSLGVLLYLLLTGHRPYRGAMSSPADIERCICQEEPVRPSLAVPREDAAASKLRRRLKGDLDNIVLMALRKEPRRRYASAEQFAEDIRRHLANLPVIARADTRAYRGAKFIQRHKPWVAAAALTFFSLAGGIAASLWQTAVARHERDRARVEQAKAARINAFLQEMVGYSGVSPGSANHMNHEATMADMLNDAAQRVETELADQPEVKAEMLGTIAGTYLSQAKYDLALRYSREAYDLDLRLYGPDARQTASVMNTLGDISYLKGDPAGADAWFEKAVPIYRAHANDPDLEVRLLAAMLSDAAFVKRALGRYDDAEALWLETLTYAPRLPTKYRSQGIAPKSFLAQLYIDRGDIEKADAMASEASRGLRALGSDRFSLAQSLIDLGNVRTLEGRYAEAESLIEEGIGLYAQAQGPDHPNVAYGLMILANAQLREGKVDLAERDIRNALKIVERRPNAGHYREALNITLSRILIKSGRARQAEPLLREALTGAQQRSRPGDVAAAAGALGECLAAQERYAEAEPLLLQSYQALKSVQLPSSPMLKEMHERMASFYAAWNKPPSPMLGEK